MWKTNQMFEELSHKCHLWNSSNLNVVNTTLARYDGNKSACFFCKKFQNGKFSLVELFPLFASLHCLRPLCCVVCPLANFRYFPQDLCLSPHVSTWINRFTAHTPMHNINTQGHFEQSSPCREKSI